VRNWTPKDTTNHQDHVIAHVLGATPLGYFVFDEALYILLDLEFVWMILLDGEMSLLPHPVAVSELALDAEVKAEIKSDIEVLLCKDRRSDKLLRLELPPVDCQIENVEFFAAGDRRRLTIAGEKSGLAIETSLATREVLVMTLDDEVNSDADDDADAKLAGVARTEHEYLHQRLREELGREPSEEELDEWLRQHTEGY
jgi:hypothetical protein